MAEPFTHHSYIKILLIKILLYIPCMYSIISVYYWWQLWNYRELLPCKWHRWDRECNYCSGMMRLCAMYFNCVHLYFHICTYSLFTLCFQEEPYVYVVHSWDNSHVYVVHSWDNSLVYVVHSWDIFSVYVTHFWDNSSDYVVHSWDISPVYVVHSWDSSAHVVNFWDNSYVYVIHSWEDFYLLL